MVKSGINPTEDVEILRALSEAPTFNIEKRFPNSLPVRELKNSRGERLADVSGLFTIHFQTPINIIGLARALSTCKNIIHAEPHYLPKPLYVPNDDSISVQYALNRIQAFAGWDLHQGDTNTVIGITDTGIELFHEDIYDNIAKNYFDPINGIDDDNDGYIDNYYGWDTGDNDNDPSSTGNPHGQHISGISSASTDNHVGIAGSGFKCRFIPIKIMDENGRLSGAYEGLMYAAEHGCKIINCSWGGYQYSEINAEILRYVSINLDCIVFCGAGNDNNERLFYPASYPYAVSVGATNNQDIKADFSNYGDRLDIFAPGDLILSTWTEGRYKRSGGTSMSSPLTAGCAAILRSAFPERSAQQILYQLKTSCDDLDLIASNSNWEGKLGSGRVNLFRALSETDKRAVVLIEPEMKDSGNQLFLPNDTLFLSGDFINYLAPAANVIASLESLTDNLEILNNQIDLGSMGSLETQSIATNPFKVLIKPTNEFNQIARLRLTISADGDEVKQTFPLEINASFINLVHNNIKSSYGADGYIAPTGDQFLRGLGMRLNDSPNYLFESGFMLSPDPSTVIDGVRGNPSNLNEWETNLRFEETETDYPNLVQFRGNMLSAIMGFPFSVNMRLIADSSIVNKGFITQVFEVENYSPIDFNDVRAGIFADWDIGNYSKNRSFYNPALKLSYVTEFMNDSVFAGVQLLGNQPNSVYAIANQAGANVNIEMTDGFSTEEKYISLSYYSPIAGAEGEGTDIITVSGSGPFSIPSGAKVNIAFAYHLATSESQLLEQANHARTFYNSIAEPLQLQSASNQDFSVFPNPASKTVTVSSNGLYSFSYTLRDLLGQTLINGKSNSQTTTLNFPKGVKAGSYILEIENNNRSTYKKLLIVNQ